MMKDKKYLYGIEVGLLLCTSKGTPPNDIYPYPTYREQRCSRQGKIREKSVTDLEATINGACRALPNRQHHGVEPYKEMPWECRVDSTQNENSCAHRIPCGLRRT